MNMDILDSISELQNTQKAVKALLELFMEAFTNSVQPQCLLAVETRFDTYSYTAHEIADLMNRAVEHAAELERLADAAWKEQQPKA